MDYKYKFQIITEEWIDIIYLYHNKSVIRKNNNEKGQYTLINNKLEIDWINWGKEVFTKHNKIENVYYNLKNNIFEIFIENNEWNDIGVFIPPFILWSREDQ